MKEKVRIEFKDWEAEGIKRFGENRKDWRFKCPMCQYVASMGDWVELGAANSVATSCIGRFTNPPSKNGFKGLKKGEPCDYAGYGLFKLNPVIIFNAPLVDKENYSQVTYGELQVFEFSD